MEKLKVVISVNTAWNLWNFRAGLIRALIEEGHEVIAIAPNDEYAERVSSLGCNFIALPMDNKGTNPFKDAVLLWRYWRLLYSLRPDVFLGFTVKPNIYGSLAARIFGISVINNIAGLGSVFNKNNWLTVLVQLLYRLALSRSTKIFFQNQDDLVAFVDHGFVNPNLAERLPGSGVNLEKFKPQNSNRNDTQVKFLLVARMLWEKGVGEYVQAADELIQKNPNARFSLLGFLDVKNPNAISRDQMDVWINNNNIDYLGMSDDVQNVMSQYDVIVLPSKYKEGTPRSLLEAAAMAKPIVTTNTPGCRDVVDDGVTGFLCVPGDANDLSRAMGLILNMTPDERRAMGYRGRLKAESMFDERLVIKKYLQSISNPQLPNNTRRH